MSAEEAKNRTYQESNGVYHARVLSYFACGWQRCTLLKSQADRVLARHKELGSQPNCIVETGDPAEKILDMAGWYKANIIVLGIRPHSVGAATHLFRPTAHRVIAGATCPVLTVRG